ncbi:MAG: hypothetical protein NUV82_04800, partial [Candidatus Komeilibacteria bacterium]|nr:hypothetical protein [Candidatus Komeilibacteria bacterium]
MKTLTKTLKRWPAEGLPEENVLSELKKRQRQNIDYDSQLISGFPGDSIDDIAGKAVNIFIKSHPN